MKKTLLLLLAVLCVAACKEEPDLPSDPHVSLINPFIGVWDAGGEYRQFRSDGTGGRAATEAGPFSNDFSFFVYAGQDVLTAPSDGSLVIIDDSGGADIVVTRYVFYIEENQAVLSPQPSGTGITLERVSGAPSPLSLANPLIGEWSATWDGLHDNSNKNDKWSIKYRADGTVKTCHLGVRHQFENGYILRGNKLVIFGAMRFSSQPITADLRNTGAGKYHVTETQASDPAPAVWDYTKVAAAEWL